jgi:hypothetical protein
MNDFERISDEVSGGSNYETSCEFAIEWVKGDKVATVTLPGNSKLNSRVRKLAEERPDEVSIRHENRDGSIVATIPVEYVKIGPKKFVSDEQRAACAERFQKLREEQPNSFTRERKSM